MCIPFRISVLFLKSFLFPELIPGRGRIFPDLFLAEIVSAGQAVLGHHGSHDADIRRDIPGRIPEELIQEALKGAVDGIQGALDLSLGVLHIRAADILAVQSRVGIDQLLGGRQIVLHHAVEIRRALRVSFDALKDARHDLLQTVQLFGEFLAGNLIVFLMNMPDKSLAFRQHLLRFLVQPGVLFRLALLPGLLSLLHPVVFLQILLAEYALIFLLPALSLASLQCLVLLVGLMAGHKGRILPVHISLTGKYIVLDHPAQLFGSLVMIFPDRG